MLNASNARHYELEAITDDSRIPATLSTDLRTWQRSDAVHVRDIAFRVGQMHSGHGWLIDGLSFDPSL